MAFTVVQDIKDSLVTRIQAVLGANYKELSYTRDVSLNTLRQSQKRYGVRALGSTQVPGVTKHLTHIQTFEVVLTEGYVDTGSNDGKQREKEHLMFEHMHEIHHDLINTRGGLPNTILNIQRLDITEPEVLEDEKVVVLKSSVEIEYRISLI